MSAAEKLRAAAAAMRTNAEAATPGPWSTVPGASNVWRFPDAGTPTVVVPGNGSRGHHVRLPDAEHIAGMDPAVALAVADLLDRAADDHDDAPCPAIDAALAVAAAFLAGADT